jgi:ankyrin repeat protein
LEEKIYLFTKLTQQTTKQQDEWNALHLASYGGAPDDIIKALIDAGADPEAKDKNGKLQLILHMNKNIQLQLHLLNSLLFPLNQRI